MTERAGDIDRLPDEAARAARLARGVVVRPATRADLDVVIALRIALLREHAGNPVYARLRPDAETRARPVFGAQLASRHETTFLAEQAGVAIGVLRCVESVGSPLLLPDRYCYVSSVYVVPEMRQRGVLRRLFAAARAWCRDRGLDEIRLHNTPDNAVASAAWSSLGFRVVEQLRLCSLD